MEINESSMPTGLYRQCFGSTKVLIDDIAENKNITELLKTSKVHVNPNFRNGKSLVIHINPRVHQNRKIHINPRMMKDIGTIADEPVKANESRVADTSRSDDGSNEKSYQKSIHVNPKLMKTWSPAARETIGIGPTNSEVVSVNSSNIGPRTDTDRTSLIDDNVSSKPATPRLLAISRRKLVRISPNAKTLNIRSPNSLKRTNKKASSLLVASGNVKKSANVWTVTKLSPVGSKRKVNAYKIDRTAVEQSKRKKICIPDARRRNTNKGLIAIGGVMYRSSRTRLVRSDTNISSRKKKSDSGAANDTFVMAKNGKKLHRLRARKEGTSGTKCVISRNSIRRGAAAATKKAPNTVVRMSQKNVMSYKVKRKSLQILRDKLRKNCIPCLLFCRFGYCDKYVKGTCPKLHDKKQVALCKNFLQGKCLLDACPLSHDVGPEKMPTCKYFLEGCCIRDACPYLHVKVSSKTPICGQFLRGYCADGSECKRRHTYACPEYERSGDCAKGKYCPYPHRPKSSATGSVKKRSGGTKSVRRSSSSEQARFDGSSSGAGVAAVLPPASEDGRKRYYEKVSPTDEELKKLRETVLERMRRAKADLGVASEGRCAEGIVENSNDVKTPSETYEETDRPKRPPIGPLPAYIPID